MTELYSIHNQRVGMIIEANDEEHALEKVQHQFLDPLDTDIERFEQTEGRLVILKVPELIDLFRAYDCGTGLCKLQVILEKCKNNEKDTPMVDHYIFKAKMAICMVACNMSEIAQKMRGRVENEEEEKE